MKVVSLLLVSAAADDVVATCSGSDDPVVSEPRCYHGKAGALGLTESVDVKIDDFASNSAGHIEVVGDGIEGFTCSNKPFSKSGQDITTDLSDCQPSGISIPSIKYCSDQDSVQVTVRADAVPIPVKATLSRVDCASEQAVASCSGSTDPDWSQPQCYHGKGGALGLTENVDVKIDDFANAAGHIEVGGSGIEDFTCTNKPFTKSGQDINTDLTDCQPDHIAITAIKYCTDQDTIKVTVKDDTIPIPVTATMKKVDCASREAVASCTGTADPVVSEPVCYHGKGGALGLTENVDVKIDDFASSAGHIEVSGDGIESFTCANKDFTKSGQDINTDLTDCQPDHIAISAIKYCSDQDTIKVTVKDDTVPIPVSATMKKVDCASREAVASCTGTADPVVSEPVCYHGKGGALGLTENVDVKIDDFANAAGHIEVSGDGIESFTCANKDFTKSGQDINTDLTDCQPDHIAITAIKYCSDQDTIKVTVKDDTVPIPVSATMKKVACSSVEVV